MWKKVGIFYYTFRTICFQDLEQSCWEPTITLAEYIDVGNIHSYLTPGMNAACFALEWINFHTPQKRTLFVNEWEEVEADKEASMDILPIDWRNKKHTPTCGKIGNKPRTNTAPGKDPRDRTHPADGRGKCVRENPVAGG